LTDAGVDPSVLSEFRDRLIAGSLERHLRDTMLTRFKAAGLRKARGRQRTDSTHVRATGPRELTVRPQAQHQALQAARKRQHPPEFKAAYAARAGIEGCLSEGVRVSDLRRSRYVGHAKTHLQHILSAAAINLRRFGAWAVDTPRARTRTPAFVKLMARAA
jgi:hypothetical protein